MKKKVISFDLDDTLFPAVENFIPFSNKKYGTKFEFHKIENGDKINKNITVKEEIRRWTAFFKYSESLKIKPYAQAKETLSKLSKEYSLIIISARDLPQQRIAKKWIDKNFPNIFSKIIFVKKKDKTLQKSKACSIEKAILHIDDNPKHVIDCTRHDIRSILINKPWNKKYKLAVPKIDEVNYKEILLVLSKLDK